MQGHIAIIDDDRLILTIAADILREAGFQVSAAESAINSSHILFSASPPDLILIDVMMPLISGDTKVKTLKKQAKLSGTKILLMSAKPEEELQELTVTAGADGYLCKPFSPIRLLSTVLAQLRKPAD